MKKKPCEKCGTFLRPSKHHVLPKVFFQGRGEIAWLCIYCHRTLEEIIYQAEKSACVTNKVRRFNLGESEYKKILRNFLTPIEYTYSLEGRLLCTASLQC